MTDTTRQLSVDEAMAEFQAIAREVLGAAAPGNAAAAATEQTEESRFSLAEVILRLACPDPRMCGDTRCRRGRLCRHFAHVRALHEGRVRTHHPRRPPDAEALRYAVWVYMNSGR